LAPGGGGVARREPRPPRGRRWWCRRCNTVRFAERNATMSRCRFREGEAPAEPQYSYLNDRGHRGHRVSLPDASSRCVCGSGTGFVLTPVGSGVARREPRPGMVKRCENGEIGIFSLCQPLDISSVTGRCQDCWSHAKAQRRKVRTKCSLSQHFILASLRLCVR